MKRNKWSMLFRWMSLLLFLLIVIGGGISANAFTLGKTYDSSNWQELEGIAPEPLMKWLKKGDFILKTAKLNFEPKLQDEFVKLSQKNEGKYDINEKGLFIEKNTGKPPLTAFGLAFPKIDSKDPKAAAKIIENFKMVRNRFGGYGGVGTMTWVNRERGPERTTLTNVASFHFVGRYGPPVPNPNKISVMMINNTIAPMGFKGTTSMVWEYVDDKEDSVWAYVPIFRRIRRSSAASRSDPSLGSDMDMDSANVYNGKNASFTWKLLGEKTILACFSSPNLTHMKDVPGKGMLVTAAESKSGFEVSGWKGAPWAPVDVIWTPRPVWMIEGVSKDPYYNYGKYIMYVDKESYMVWFKEYYDRALQYQKSLFPSINYQIDPQGRDSIGRFDTIVAIDDKTDHGTVVALKNNPSLAAYLYMPLEALAPSYFTQANMLELSK